VIPKSAQPERIASNFALFGFSLSADEMRQLDGLSRTLTGAAR
jgi:diketogulonate reductase-like aldo/keto reductase